MIILIVGACGAGKTWVMQQLINKFNLNITGKIDTIYFHRNEKIAALGKYDGTVFQGSDRLSMAVMAALPEFLEYAKGRKLNVICEGDRFMNSTFIDQAKPYIIKIKNDGSQGRKIRGSSQTERQLKSVATRVSKVKADFEVDNSDQALKKILSMLK